MGKDKEQMVNLFFILVFPLLKNTIEKGLWLTHYYKEELTNPIL